MLDVNKGHRAKLIGFRLTRAEWLALRAYAARVRQPMSRIVLALASDGLARIIADQDPQVRPVESP